MTRNGRIGIIGTPATIRSGSYEKAIQKLHPEMTAFGQACPLFVHLVENGYTDFHNPVTRLVAEEYLGQDAATLETSLDWISYQDLAISEEAIYLADRVVILDANPGQIKAVLTIPLGKHRDRTSEDFLAIRDQIFEIFHMKREDAIEYYT